MSKALFIGDVGMYRVAKNDAVDAGDDGMMWLPENNVVAVADGIGGENGHGMKDIRRFRRALSNQENSRDGFREAFFSICGERSQSTMVTMRFPEYANRKGLLLSAGDSHCFRLREDSRKQVLQLLTDEHTTWNDLQQNASDDVLEIIEELGEVFTEDQIRQMEDKQKIWKLINALNDEFPQPDFVFPFSQLGIDDFSIDELKNLLLISIQYATYKFYLCLCDTRKKVEETLGKGTYVSVKEGDRFAFVSDGIYRDVLRLDEVHEVLATVSDPHEIGNVLGIEGVEYMIRNGNRTPFKFYFGAPS